MATIVGISGSLRKGSLNTTLLRALAKRTPAGSSIEIASIADVPLYNGDVEKEQGPPAAVVALKRAVSTADGLLLVSPEYNHGVPGVLKNAIDWMSRPDPDQLKPFVGKPTAVCGASPGSFGTALAQAAWLPTLRTLGTIPFFGGMLLVGSAMNALGNEDEITDDRTRDRADHFLEDFLAFVAKHGA